MPAPSQSFLIRWLRKVCVSHKIVIKKHAIFCHNIIAVSIHNLTNIFIMPMLSLWEYPHINTLLSYYRRFMLSKTEYYMKGIKYV